MDFDDIRTGTRSALTDVRDGLVKAMVKGVRQAVPSGIAQITGRSAPDRGTAELIAAYRTSPWLRAVVSKIAFKFASVPWQLFMPLNARGQAMRSIPLQTAGFDVRYTMLAELKAHQRLREIEDHPLLELMATANPTMTGLNARRFTQTYLELKGESFWVLEVDGKGQPFEYWPVPPSWVTRVPHKPDEGFDLTIQGRVQIIPEECMIWFRELNTSNPYGRGTGIAESLGDEIETDEYAAKFLKQFFFNSAKPDLIIGLEGNEVSTEQLKKAKTKMEQQHRGMFRGFQSFWHAGKLTVKELQQSLVDMGLIDLRTWDRNIVINVFGVPPEVLGILENSNRATISAALVIMASEVIIPRMEFMLAELQMKLVPLFDERLVLGYVSPMPIDKEQKLKSIQAAPWAATRGEIRQLQGLDHRGEPDNVHLVPTKLIEVPAPPLPTQRALPAPSVRLLRPAKEIDIEAALGAMRLESLTRETDHLWRVALQEWCDRTVASLGSPELFDMDNPLVETHLADMAKRIEGAHETTFEEVQVHLDAGVEEGDSGEAFANRVGLAFEHAIAFRAPRIARRATLLSANFGTYAAHLATGVRLRQWIPTPAGTCHIGFTGMTAGTDDFFGDDGSLQYPGALGSQNDCGCTTVALTDHIAIDVEAANAVARLFEAERAPWERAAIAALRRGFRAQLSDVLAALEQAAA